jgi:hypothetical protein
MDRPRRGWEVAKLNIASPSISSMMMMILCFHALVYNLFLMHRRFMKMLQFEA